MDKEKGFGELLSPVVAHGVVNTVENHLNQGDQILRAILDVAEAGIQASGDMDDRYDTIIELLQMYRAGNSALIQALYDGKKKRKAVKAVEAA